jgi:hypothetical protein
MGRFLVRPLSFRLRLGECLVGLPLGLGFGCRLPSSLFLRLT